MLSLAQKATMLKCLRKAVVYGDYLIPDLILSDTTEHQIGKYGRMRQRFLMENHGGIYSYYDFVGNPMEIPCGSE